MASAWGRKYQIWGVHLRQRRENESPKLYNVVEYIGETNNVIEAHPEIAEKLRKRMDEFDAGGKGWCFYLSVTKSLCFTGRSVSMNGSVEGPALRPPR